MSGYAAAYSSLYDTTAGYPSYDPGYTSIYDPMTLYSFTVQVTDSGGATATQALSITVDPAAPLPGGISVPGLPAVTVSAQFAPGTWADISAYVRSGTITRPTTREQGPLYSYQAGTASLVLKNDTGRFDPDNLSGQYVSVNPIRKLTLTGAGTWVAPANITGTMKAECWGGGGGGSSPANNIFSGGGGGAGEYAAEPSLAVSPGQSFTYGQGPGGGDASDGADTTFGPVTAHGGSAASGQSGGAGGSGSANTTHHSGGAGGAGTVTSSGGGGGGGSGGTSSAGNKGGSATPRLITVSGYTGGSAGAGAPAVAGGGPGGDGGDTGKNGHTPATGPGGGGGGSGAGGARAGGGSDGQIILTYTLAGTYTQVLPMVPIQVTATWAGTTYSLFSGTADAWQDNGANLPTYSEVTLTATDGQKVLNNITLAQLPNVTGGGDDAGTRVSRILDAVGWSPVQRRIVTDDTPLQSTVYGDTAWNLMQLAADSDAGELYIDGSGDVVFRARQNIITSARSVTPQAVFGDRPGTAHSAGTELAYSRVGRANDDTTLANDIQATRAAPPNATAGGVMQEATDAASVAQYLYPRTYARSDLILTDDATVAQWAGWVLYISSTSEDRFDTLELQPQRDGANLFPQALGREIGDRIQVWRRPPNAGTITKDCFVRGIEHSWDYSSLAWSTTWTLQSASKYARFGVWDTSTFDSGAAYAW